MTPCPYCKSSECPTLFFRLSRTLKDVEVCREATTKRAEAAESRITLLESIIAAARGEANYLLRREHKFSLVHAALRRVKAKLKLPRKPPVG